jgi:glyoxylase-like metal-dependent hydrolase (beta-lactamase superfamily II)
MKEKYMQQEIKTFTLPLPFKMGSVNCYLVETNGGYMLIDTAGSNARRQLAAELGRAGCKPGDLTLIVLTHGDFDHIGNAAHLRDTYGAKIAMHKDDSGMAERGDMFWNRKSANALIKMLAPILFRFGAANRFSPDITIQDGTALGEYGFDATVLSIPGHSKGSIGILTAGGDLFCGDLFSNTDQPALNSIMDDLPAAHASLEKLRGLAIETVYPGHGKPFSMEQFLKNFQNMAIPE